VPATRHILNISPVENLRRTRAMMLEAAGFNVTSAASTREAEHICRRASFDLVIIGQNFDNDEKRRVASAVRTILPQVTILELCRISPEIQSLDFVLYDPTPEELVDFVQRLLLPRGSKPVKLND
jgi:DNA-binding response OmpR family regulator